MQRVVYQASEWAGGGSGAGKPTAWAARTHPKQKADRPPRHSLSKPVPLNGSRTTSKQNKSLFRKHLELKSQERDKTVEQMREHYNHITEVIGDKKLNDGIETEYQVESLTDQITEM